AAGSERAAGARVTLVGIVPGILRPTRGPAPPGPGACHTGAGTIVRAVLSASAFGASLYAVGRVGRDLPIAWAVLPARAVGVGVVALPLLVSSRLRLPRPALPFVLAGGAVRAPGTAAFTVRGRHGSRVRRVPASTLRA